MKFSIIIPVYNVEKYIEKCLMSILNQDYMSYEIIVVDDGSTDKSGEICDRYAQQYDNITVFHIPNGGVSNARNIGLMKAQGEYVWFIDSDDYIESTALDRIATHISRHKELELLIFDAVVTDEEGNRIGEITSNLPCGQVFRFETYRELVFIDTSSCNRIYRTDLLRDKHLLFETDITIAEDLLFNYKYLLECQNVYYEKDAIYYYVRRKNSAMTGAGKNEDVQKAFERLISYYKKKEKYATYKNEIDYLAIYHYFIVTSVRMVRCGICRDECLSVPAWFSKSGIKLSLKNIYVRKMALKHILTFVLLKFKCYKIISMLFSRL